LFPALVVEHDRRQRGKAAAAGTPVVIAAACGIRSQGQRLRLALLEHRGHCIEHRLLGVHALELPEAQASKQCDAGQRQQPTDQEVCAATHARAIHACDNGAAPLRRALAATTMNDSLKTLLIVAFLVVIVWNLGAGLYYMLVDKGTTKRTVNALTKRIALSVALSLLVALSIYMGWITPPGVGG